MFASKPIQDCNDHHIPSTAEKIANLQKQEAVTQMRSAKMSIRGRLASCMVMIAASTLAGIADTRSCAALIGPRDYVSDPIVWEVKALSIEYYYDCKNHTLAYLIVDPYNVKEFNLGVSFDPAAFAFDSITYLNGFSEVSAPDLTQVTNGLILDIHGENSNPPTGDVDIFRVNLNPIQNSGTYTASTFAGPTGFIKGFDPVTSQETFIGASNIGGASTDCPICPEPSSLALLVFGTVGVMAASCKAKFNLMYVG